MNAHTNFRLWLHHIRMDVACIYLIKSRPPQDLTVAQLSGAPGITNVTGAESGIPGSARPAKAALLTVQERSRTPQY